MTQESMTLIELADKHAGTTSCASWAIHAAAANGFGDRRGLVLAFPKEHRPQVASTNPLERVNKDNQTSLPGGGHIPNDAAIDRLVGPIRGYRMIPPSQPEAPSDGL